MDELDIPKLKKINATISEKLYIELSKRNILNNSFDTWLSMAIIEKIEREELK